MLSRRRSTSARIAELSPGKTNPAASLRSVGGMNACAVSRCGWYDSVSPSGAGKDSPSELSKGSFDSDANREFHMRLGKNAVLIAIGVRLEKSWGRAIRATRACRSGGP